MLTPAARINLDLAIQNLTTEISNLEKLRRLFEKEDQSVLKVCNIRLNELLFDILSRNSVTNLGKRHEI